MTQEATSVDVQFGDFALVFSIHLTVNISRVKKGSVFDVGGVLCSLGQV